MLHQPHMARHQHLHEVAGIGVRVLAGDDDLVDLLFGMNGDDRGLGRIDPEQVTDNRSVHARGEIADQEDDLVAEIEVDLSAIKTADDTIYVEDITAPKGVEILTDPNLIVARFEFALTEEEGTGEEGEGGAEAVEVISRGKKDEEDF